MGEAVREREREMYGKTVTDVGERGYREGRTGEKVGGAQVWERERVGQRCGRERGWAQVWERERVGHRCGRERGWGTGVSMRTGNSRCEREATLLPRVGPAEGLQCQS